jgi:uncharacterized protein (DUF2126 family)/transglutaminase-like putative cysteine protease
MSIRLAIEHRTTYRYDRPVRLGPHVVRLRPAPHTRTPVLSYSLQVSPSEHFVNWQQDPFGNHLARFVFPKPATELTVTVDLVADMTAINPFDFFVEEEAREWPFRYEPSVEHDLAPYLTPEVAGPLLQAWTDDIPRGGKTGTVDFLVELNQRVLRSVAYSVRMDPGVQTPEQTLELAVGSCRDSAWLLVQVLRTLGIAARFASGYLVQLVEDDPDAPGPANDFTDLHAWAEAYIPGAGWVGLDATSGWLTGEGHIPLACTADPQAAAPIVGSTDRAETTFEYANIVRRIHESPRVTLPYSEEQWARIDALGHKVDEALKDGDVRLTMGGEPTFISAKDSDAPEWSIEADGGEKQALAIALTRRLAAKLTSGALIQHGQGKWYPGEPLPRWQLGVFWRNDGEPLWRDPALLADPTKPGTATAADGEAVMAAIADALGVPEEFRHAVYEDPIARVWDESRLPGGDPPAAPTPDPTNGVLADRDARLAIIDALDAERGDPAGWALPLHRSPGEVRWSTGRWQLRRGHVFLVAGDSPVGLRLPLGSLTWTPPEQDLEQSLFRTVETLATDRTTRQIELTEPPPITALCVEVRKGHVHVFLPPLEELEHAAELVAMIEDAARTAGLQLIVEGYGLPKDTRAGHFVVAPDPGVIEVNIDPSSSWQELVDKTLTMAREAHEIGLRTEKFALDGTHTGTGGGSHITLGGPTPADSPLLRRPDLLRSLLTYWQHHPSLSYLFSGRFIGPTSQAPRIDEGRHESLYELEIAFAELERLSTKGPAPPWQVDRLFRHLLVDVSGNTHRAEFCIDKLFSPDTESGRLGVVELRGFEMPPHPRMALVQALLVRALVARLWSEPYVAPLVRWGTDLHDRFLLPWSVEADIRSVVDDLVRHRIPFESAWFEPFLAFRFPVLGTLTVEEMTLELRAAIEPWHVLGEEQAGATARYVDSSLERLQVRVDGLTEPRYAITCNGFEVPLLATDALGTYVGAVRYRAWQPASALHPTIAVHTPLTFDVIDRWSERSVGGCRYHVSHPGGLAYERLPASSKEAEARRASRFETTGHSPGPVQVTEVRRTGEYPRTLDLRRAGTR